MGGVQGCRTDDRTDSLLRGQAGCGEGWLGSAEQVSCQLRCACCNACRWSGEESRPPLLQYCW